MNSFSFCDFLYSVGAGENRQKTKTSKRMVVSFCVVIGKTCLLFHLTPELLVESDTLHDHFSCVLSACH